MVLTVIADMHAGAFGAAGVAALDATRLEADPGDVPAAVSEHVTVLPCRPTIACTADLVPPGALEIEAGVVGRRAGSLETRATPLLVKLTIAPWIQAQLATNGYTATTGVDGARFVDDIAPGIKLHLVDQGPTVPSLAVSSALSVPIPAEQRGYVRTLDAFFTGYATKDFGPLHVDLNGGVNAWRIDGAAAAQGFGAVAFSTTLPPPFGVMAEAYVFSDAAPMAPRDGGFLFAVTHAPVPWLMFDFGGDVGWFPSTRAYSLFVGLTVVPVRLWHAVPKVD